MTPKLQHSPQRTQWVTGHIARNHGDVSRDKLQAIVADALEGALIHDHDQITPNRPRGRADSVPAGGIRTDGAKPPMTNRDPKRDAAEKQRARQDAALAEIRSAHTKSRGSVTTSLESDMFPLRERPECYR